LHGPCLTLRLKPQFDLIRVVTLHAKLLSGMRLSNIVGLRVCINLKYKNIILIKIYLLPNIPHI
jgi:hypothetical protein